MKNLFVYIVLLPFILVSGCSSNLETLIVSENINTTSDKWKGKTIYTFGDSITWYDGNEYSESHNNTGEKAIGYQSYIRRELGAEVKNFGISGESLVGIANEIKSVEYSGVDAVTITGGVNDWYKLIPIGKLQAVGTKYDLSTSYGALQSSIEHIKSQNSNLSIYLLTPIPGVFKDESSEPLAGQELPITYREMFIQIGELYDIPVLDWYKETNFDEDYAHWYQDKEGSVLGDRYIHVGNEGYEVMSESLIPFLVEN